MEDFNNNSSAVLNNAKLEYEKAYNEYKEVQKAQSDAAENMPQIKKQLDDCIADEEAKKKLMEDALSNEMNLRKNIGQIKDEINKINFRLHEAVEN